MSFKARFKSAKSLACLISIGKVNLFGSNCFNH